MGFAARPWAHRRSRLAPLPNAATRAATEPSDREARASPTPTPPPRQHLHRRPICPRIALNRSPPAPCPLAPKPQEVHAPTPSHVLAPNHFDTAGHKSRHASAFCPPNVPGTLLTSRHPRLPPPATCHRPLPRARRAPDTVGWQWAIVKAPISSARRRHGAGSRAHENSGPAFGGPNVIHGRRTMSK